MLFRSSYDSMHLELPDVHMFFAPVINWGKYKEENSRLLLSFSPRAEKLPCGNLSLLLNSELFKKTFSFTASMGHSTASAQKNVTEGREERERQEK